MESLAREIMTHLIGSLLATNRRQLDSQLAEESKREDEKYFSILNFRFPVLPSNFAILKIYLVCC